jgi:hypothetical protein
MARDRDDDSRDSRDDSRDDRPRRRRDDDGPKKGGKGWLIALIVVGGILLVCGGVIGVAAYFINKGIAAASQFVDQVGGTMQASMEANSFLSKLDTAPESAYESTTADYKKTTSKEQFLKLLKDHPVLTEQHYSKGGSVPTPAGTSPNRKLTVTYTVIAGVDPNPDTTPTGTTSTGTGKTAATGTRPTVPPSTAPKTKSVTVTLNMVEQPDKTWKVDGFTVQ